jgi:hypothetical protein
MDTPMSRAERPSRTESASGKGSPRRGLGFDSAPEAESIRFGCSMLSRIRLRLDDPNALATMRCSLGFALHSNEDAERCMGVESPADCWKSAQSWRVPAQELPAARSQPVRAARAATEAEASESENGTVVSAVIIEKSVEVIGVVRVVAGKEPRAND